MNIIGMEYKGMDGVVEELNGKVTALRASGVGVPYEVKYDTALVANSAEKINRLYSSLERCEKRRKLEINVRDFKITQKDVSKRRA